jgi:DNA-3-methyladenine glycosylase II
MSDSPERDEAQRAALEALSERDGRLAAAYANCGLPPVRRGEEGLPGLLRILMAQQVSVASARAIIARLEAAVPGLEAEALQHFGEAELRALGLSRQKAQYLRGLTEMTLSGALDFAGLRALDDEEAIAGLCRAKGVGRWTAEIYLLFCLGRPDVFPAGDLALQVAMQRLLRQRARPDAKKAAAVAKRRWRPYRGAAARFLWHFYRHPGLPD